MAYWMEPPKTRIYCVHYNEIRRGTGDKEWEFVGEDGEPTNTGDRIYRAIRPDGKVFKIASWLPMQEEDGREVTFYLEEV